MSIQSLYFLLIILLGRNTALLFPCMDIWKKHILLFMINAVLITPLLTFKNIHLYLLILVLVLGVDIFLMRQSKDKILGRVIATAVIIFLIMTPVNMKFFNNSISGFIENMICAIINAGPAFDWINVSNVRNAMIVIIGGIIIVYEGNILVVLLLKRISLFADKKEAKVIKRNEGMGKWIGYLERTIVYILIITGNFSTIGFVIAVKALSRFKELENKEFAEYFIVGTMASMIITIVISLFVKSVIQGQSVY
jgi:hypothetical protein